MMTPKQVQIGLYEPYCCFDIAEAVMKHVTRLASFPMRQLQNSKAAAVGRSLNPASSARTMMGFDSAAELGLRRSSRLLCQDSPVNATGGGDVQTTLTGPPLERNRTHTYRR